MYKSKLTDDYGNSEVSRRLWELLSLKNLVNLYFIECSPHEKVIKRQR